ncbi:hypothetical protein [Herbidospora cretacea]|uniref:hypothetical protein n=1 Tax=Herbidospora cretacea TaxID=28444 RepID=UPI000AFC3258|nr:hypothetical protein [Herbidospora cretacea]
MAWARSCFSSACAAMPLKLSGDGAVTPPPAGSTLPKGTYAYATCGGWTPRCDDGGAVPI